MQPQVATLSDTPQVVTLTVTHYQVLKRAPSFGRIIAIMKEAGASDLTESIQDSREFVSRVAQFVFRLQTQHAQQLSSSTQEMQKQISVLLAETIQQGKEILRLQVENLALESASVSARELDQRIKALNQQEIDQQRKTIEQQNSTIREQQAKLNRYLGLFGVIFLMIDLTKGLFQSLRQLGPTGQSMHRFTQVICTKRLIQCACIIAVCSAAILITL